MKHQQLSRANGTKRPFLLALIAFSLGFCHYAEAKVQPTEAFTSNVDSLIINDNNKDKDETIYEAVDEMPKFPGGTQALFKYLGENIQYPEEVQKLGIAGRVITQFVISKKGEITSVAESAVYIRNWINKLFKPSQLCQPGHREKKMEKWST